MVPVEGRVEFVCNLLYVPSSIGSVKVFALDNNAFSVLFTPLPVFVLGLPTAIPEVGTVLEKLIDVISYVLSVIVLISPFPRCIGPFTSRT